ncbi:hypothetical protein POM88_042542 [Heracleum sosnowskyi]|uniref:Uncharacterized protein n=1 Tax=Heracleum sosnowskyi TaxID=360622 RepID=A0AAD8HGZ0_9APIA|nr:hypothetical protein POM88_042542 [Heracleum sosnowskyi]
MKKCFESRKSASIFIESNGVLKYSTVDSSAFGSLARHSTSVTITISRDDFMAHIKNNMMLVLCTLNDVGDLLYMLYRSSLKVQESGDDDVTLIVRLSPLLRMDTPCYGIRSDVSIAKKHRGKFGIGYLEESILKAQLHVISRALETVIKHLEVDVKMVRIQMDCDSAVNVLERKVSKIPEEVKDVICTIGVHLKVFEEYSVSQLYPELNMDCDHLTNVFGADHSNKHHITR